MMNITDNPHLHKTDVRRCFTFYKSDEYPNGAIKISKEDALITVNEIIEYSTNKCCEFQNVKYWKEVKQELENL